jgi:hypothetical protein
MTDEPDEEMSLDKFIERKTPKRPMTASRQAAHFDRALERSKLAEVESDPTELLVLAHARYHQHVYGAVPTNTRNEFSTAVVAIRAFIKREFDGDSARAQGFVKWAWRREQRTAKWLKAEKKLDKKPMGWRQLISTTMLDTYRAEAMAKGDK